MDEELVSLVDLLVNDYKMPLHAAQAYAKELMMRRNGDWYKSLSQEALNNDRAFAGHTLLPGTQVSWPAAQAHRIQPKPGSLVPTVPEDVHGKVPVAPTPINAAQPTPTHLEDANLSSWQRFSQLLDLITPSKPKDVSAGMGSGKRVN